MSALVALAFAGAFAAALILPGPNVAFCIAQSLQHGFREAIPIALGFSAATTIHAAVVFSGVGLVAARLPDLLDVLKWAGVAYLLWLSYKAFSRAATLEAARARKVSAWRLVGGAMTVSLTNPKGIAASVILYPAFISDSGGYVAQAVLLGAIATLVSFSVYASYIALASRLQTSLGEDGTLRYWVGALYALAALGVLLVSTGA